MAVQAFAPLLPSGMNADVLQRLIFLCGPETTGELLERIVADLTAARSALSQAAGQKDWPAIKAQSHVLIAIAGTIGALGVHQQAQILNEWAHGAADDDHLVRMVRDVAVGVDALVHYVKSLIASQGAIR